MLYFKALRDGLAQLPAADPSIRDSLLQRAEAEGWEKLHEKLQQVDPKAAERIKPADTQRLQRALEVYEAPDDHCLTGMGNRNNSNCRTMSLIWPLLHRIVQFCISALHFVMSE